MRWLCRLAVVIAVGACVASAMGATTGAGYGLRPAAADGAVAYTRHLHGNRPFINVVDLAGGEEHEITPRAPGVAWEVYNPVWSPDGSQLAFVREGTGGGPSVAFLYVANSDGSDLHRVLRIKPWTGYSA